MALIPAKVHIGYECNGGMTYPVICDQGYDPNWIWIWIYPVWDLMIYPVLRWGDCSKSLSKLEPFAYASTHNQEAHTIKQPGAYLTTLFFDRPGAYLTTAFLYRPGA